MRYWYRFLYILTISILAIFEYKMQFIYANKLSTAASTALRKNRLQPVTLLTFDVDGTLLQGSSKQAEVSSHARAFVYAIYQVFHEYHSYDVNVFNQSYPFPSPLEYIPPERYHGGTDGLIALNLAKRMFDIDAKLSYPLLNKVFEKMYHYISNLSDNDVSKGIEALPGITETLTNLVRHEHFTDHILCGLVTGNVEGIARKKMRATGLYEIGFLSPKASDQVWQGDDESSFLGGFGSDFCSGDIEDITRMYKDRGHQIVIATKRALNLLKPNQKLVRVVHIGDAPNDILGAKYCFENNLLGDVSIDVIGVATGKFSKQCLEEFAGSTILGKWNPIILEKGVGDNEFIKHCKIISEM